MAMTINGMKHWIDTTRRTGGRHITKDDIEDIADAEMIMHDDIAMANRIMEAVVTRINNSITRK